MKASGLIEAVIASHMKFSSTARCILYGKNSLFKITKLYRLSPFDASPRLLANFYARSNLMKRTFR